MQRAQPGPGRVHNFEVDLKNLKTTIINHTRFIRTRSEPVQAGFQTQTETGFVPVIPTGGHKCDICDGHNRSQSVTLFEIGHSGFQKFFLAKRVWSQSVTIGHNRSQCLFREDGAEEQRCHV